MKYWVVFGIRIKRKDLDNCISDLDKWMNQLLSLNIPLGDDLKFNKEYKKIINENKIELTINENNDMIRISSSMDLDIGIKKLIEFFRQITINYEVYVAYAGGTETGKKDNKLVMNHSFLTYGERNPKLEENLTAYYDKLDVQYKEMIKDKPLVLFEYTQELESEETSHDYQIKDEDVIYSDVKIIYLGLNKSEKTTLEARKDHDHPPKCDYVSFGSPFFISCVTINKDNNFYKSLKELNKNLGKIGLKILCNGTSKGVYLPEDDQTNGRYVIKKDTNEKVDVLNYEEWNENNQK